MKNVGKKWTFCPRLFLFNWTLPWTAIYYNIFFIIWFQNFETNRRRRDNTNRNKITFYKISIQWTHKHIHKMHPRATENNDNKIAAKSERKVNSETERKREERKQKFLCSSVFFFLFLQWQICLMLLKACFSLCKIEQCQLNNDNLISLPIKMTPIYRSALYVPFGWSNTIQLISPTNVNISFENLFSLLPYKTTIQFVFCWIRWCQQVLFINYKSFA